MNEHDKLTKNQKSLNVVLSRLHKKNFPQDLTYINNTLKSQYENKQSYAWKIKLFMLSLDMKIAFGPVTHQNLKHNF
jgi:hypothetical protein